MTIEISVAIAVLIFAILAAVIIITLVRVNNILKDVELKSKRLNSLFNTVSNLGEVCERNTNQVKKNDLVNTNDLRNDGYYPEVAALLLLGLKLGEKYLKNRG